MTTTAKKFTRVLRLEVTADEAWLTCDGDAASDLGMSRSWTEMEERIISAINRYENGFYFNSGSGRPRIDIIEWEDGNDNDRCPECEGTNINWDFAECRDCKGGPND